MFQTVKSGLKSNEGKAVLYAGLIGLFLSDIIPTPADAVYFAQERRLRDKWKRGEITPQSYWKQTAAYYYFLNPIWWAIVAGVTVSIKGDVTKKLKIAGALIGSGAVLAIIYKNIQKDEKELSDELQEKRLLLLEHPEYADILNKTNNKFNNITGENLKKQNA